MFLKSLFINQKIQLNKKFTEQNFTAFWQGRHGFLQHRMQATPDGHGRKT